MYKGCNYVYKRRTGMTQIGNTAIGWRILRQSTQTCLGAACLVHVHSSCCPLLNSFTLKLTE